MTTLYHTQCVLSRGKRQTTSWIPRKIARIGERVRLKEQDGTWSYWTVVSTGQTLLSKTVLGRRNAHKNMRKMTDI